MNFDDLWPFDEWMETKRTTISLKLIWIISLLNISRFDQSRKRTEREMMKLVNNLMLACAKWQLSRVEPAFNGLFKFISSASTECPCFMPRIVDHSLAHVRSMWWMSFTHHFTFTGREKIYQAIGWDDGKYQNWNVFKCLWRPQSSHKVESRG